MTYRTAVEKFKIKYNLYARQNKLPQIALDEKEVFMLVADSYARLANRHKLIMKYSTDNATPQLNLVAGQSSYTSGTGASNLPSDVSDIYLVTLNDTQKTPLKKVNIYTLRDIVRSTAQPTAYAVDKSNKVLEIDTSPSEGYAQNTANRLIIHYIPKILSFTGSDSGSDPGAAGGGFADLNFANATYGGSFLTPDEWDDCIVTYAVAFLIPQLTPIAIELEQGLLASRPMWYDYEIQYYNGGYEFKEPDTEEPGWDSGRE